jgi:hypothetical protein
MKMGEPIKIEIPNPVVTSGTNGDVSPQPTEPVNLEIANNYMPDSTSGGILPTFNEGGNSELEANRISVTPLVGDRDIFSTQNKQ